ncbi:MAG: DUF302 domain-containing protein [Thermomicrobiales bacterium]
MDTMTRHEMDLGFTTVLDLPIDAAIERTRDVLKAEGFGILTTIDVRSTLKEKIDVDFIPYVILGACNPRFAHQALLAEKQVGLLLPCNVIVYEEDGKSTVSIANPEVMLSVGIENDSLASVAAEAAITLRRVAAALQ